MYLELASIQLDCPATRARTSPLLLSSVVLMSSPPRVSPNRGVDNTFPGQAGVCGVYLKFPRAAFSTLRGSDYRLHTTCLSNLSYYLCFRTLSSVALPSAYIVHYKRLPR
jgi:hypothetical protein